MPKTDRTRSLLVAVAAVVLAASVGLGLHAAGVIAPVRAKDASITIKDYAFDPDPVTITAGSVVTWTNTSGQNHTVTSDTGDTLNSGPIGPGEAYGNLFDTPGTYAYHCAIHPDRMKGTIIVKAAPKTPVPSGLPSPTPPPGTLPPNFSPHPVQTPPPLPSSVPTSLNGTASPATNGNEAPISQTGTDSGVALLVVGLLIAASLAGGALIARAYRRR